MDLDGSRAAITGAARDTGRLPAEVFTERGARIFLSARDVVAARQVADTINKPAAGRADAFHCDLAAPDSVRGFTAAVADRTSRRDALINNVRLTSTAPTWQTSRTIRSRARWLRPGPAPCC